MIFVTTGTTLPFDSLIEEIDNLCAENALGEEVICQIGRGKYEPSHCEFVRFLPNIDEQIHNSSLVVGHGGTGTTLELLLQGKNFISIANPIAAEDHQAKFLERLSKDVEFVWTRDPREIVNLIDKARQRGVLRSRLPSLIPSLAGYIEQIVSA